MAFMCPICDLDFKTLPELARHNATIHDPTSSTDRPKVSMPPGPEDFARAKEELKKQEKQQEVKKPEEKRDPPRLDYKWMGDCPDCGGSLDTIQVPIGEYISCVAYCPSCKKQLAQLPVIPIKEQMPKYMHEAGKPIRRL